MCLCTFASHVFSLPGQPRPVSPRSAEIDRRSRGVTAVELDAKLECLGGELAVLELRDRLKRQRDRVRRHARRLRHHTPHAPRFNVARETENRALSARACKRLAVQSFTTAGKYFFYKIKIATKPIIYFKTGCF